MKVILARKAGFCMGVRRAVEMVLEEVNSSQEDIVTYGPLIHNQEVLDMLAERGIRAVDDPDLLTGTETAVVRAHGLPPAAKTRLKEAANRVLDATCPRVVRVQLLIRRHTAQGGWAVILGDADHAEVKGLLGHAVDGRGVVIDSADQVAGLPDHDNVLLVAQTTQSEELFHQVRAAVLARWPEASVQNTVCHATHERQAEVRQLAGQVEAVVVVGGSFSANTQRLASIAAEAGAEVFPVEKASGLDREKLSRFNSVGVTAGASTPNWLIRQVVEELRGLPGRSESAWQTLRFRMIRFLIKSNTLIAMGGAGLALIAGLNLLPEADWRLAAVPFLYLYAMHTLNHFVDRRAAEYNDPDRAKFFTKHQNYLVLTALLAATLGLLAALGPGPASFFTLLGLMIGGLVYSVRLVPARWEHLMPYAKLKDFPGSKPLSIALAWAAACGLWPFIAYGGAPLPGLVVVLVIGLLAFARAVFFGINDVQGDLIVGRESLALVLGREKTLRLLLGLTTAAALIAALAALGGLVHPSALIFTAAALGLGTIILAYQRGRLLPGGMLEGLVEADFMACGIAALLVWLT